MIDLAAISSAIGSIKAAGDIAGAMLKLRDGQLVQEKTLELNRIILSAQADVIAANVTQTDLIAEIGELKNEIARMKNWEADKSRYELTELAPGTVAYILKESMRDGEPIHRICANCCANGKKSFLQQHVRGTSYDVFKCNGCGESLTVDKDKSPIRYRDSGNQGGWMSA